MNNLDIFLDFLKEIWAYQFPKALVLNLLWYLIYLCSKRNALVDFGWGFNQMIMAISFIVQYHEYTNWKTWVILVLIIVWGLRLAGFILVTRIFVKYTDSRYKELSEKNKKENLFYLFQFIFQAILVMFPFSVCYWVFRKYNIIKWNFYLGIVISIISLILEIISDMQIENFKNKKKSEKLMNSNDIENKPLNKQPQLMKEGLWKKSRHPNLFFELCFWIGIMIIGFNDWISLLGIIGPLSLFLIMYFITIPITERSMKSRRPNWDELIKGTNKFLPIF